VRLSAEQLDGEGFAPFGSIIGPTSAGPDATGAGWRWWAETALMERGERPYAIGYLELEPLRPLGFDWAERHMRSVEVILPLGASCLVYVGPPDHPEEPGRAPDIERFRAFLVPPGRGVLLNRGVWHGAPLAPDGPLTAAVLLQEETGRLDTNVVHWGAAIEIHVEEGPADAHR
jgi:ureidoglycolate lyase